MLIKSVKLNKKESSNCKKFLDKTRRLLITSTRHCCEVKKKTDRQDEWLLTDIQRSRTFNQNNTRAGGGEAISTTRPGWSHHSLMERGLFIRCVHTSRHTGFHVGRHMHAKISGSLVTTRNIHFSLYITRIKRV